MGLVLFDTETTGFSDNSKIIQLAFMYQDKALASLDAQSSHTVHPIGYFNGR